MPRKRDPSASAACRVLTKMSVDLCSCTMSRTTRAWLTSSGAIILDLATASSVLVISGRVTTKSDIFAAETSRTETALPVPARKCPISCGLPTVADRPILWNSPTKSDNRSRPIASCAPRFELARSWISSMMTNFTDLKFSPAVVP